MKKILALAAIIALSFPAAGQGNPPPGGNSPPTDSTYTPAPVSAAAQQALNACPGLMQRTDAAMANGHQSYYYSSDCECMAYSIDSKTWDSASSTYSGPKMPESDAQVIISALSTAPTIEDAFDIIDTGLSELGYSATAACFDK